LTGFEGLDNIVKDAIPEGCEVVSDLIRKNMALFPMSIVMNLTNLTARQIRYYEQHELVCPSRSEGNKRLFSFNDVTRLLQIKDLIEKGVNIAGVKQVLLPVSKAQTARNEPLLADNDKVTAKAPTDLQIHKMLKARLVGETGRRGEVSLIQGDLARFFRK
jgi:MerR family glutamine synthetase transcriptional repressor